MTESVDGGSQPSSIGLTASSTHLAYNIYLANRFLTLAQPIICALTLNCLTHMIMCLVPIELLHIGTVKIINFIELKHVLHVPGIHFNPISIPKLCEDMGCTFTFTASTFFI